MTERLYLFDSYVRTCDAVVTDCTPHRDAFWVELSRTCFFPEGGGQPGDTGTLSGVAVTDTIERDGRIWHVTEHPFTPGDPVHGILDFDRRFSHMQTHCGEHLFSAVLLRLFGTKNVGFHMGHEDVTIDMDLPLSAEQVAQAEEEANRVIRQGLPVRVSEKSPEELDRMPLRKRPFLDRPLRLVEIVGCDLCCCCGTHVASTAEIGLLKVLSHEHYKGGTRIHFLCGTDAFSDYREKHRILEEASHAFSCRPDGFLVALEKQTAELAELKARNAAKGKALFEYMAADYATHALQHGEVCLVLEQTEGLTPDEMRMLAVRTAQYPHVCCILFDRVQGKIVATKAQDLGIDLRATWKALCDKLPLRGGGSPVLIQGSFQDVSPNEIQSAVSDVIK